LPAAGRDGKWRGEALQGCQRERADGGAPAALPCPDGAPAVTAGRDKAASAAQYVLLGSFAAVASGISSQGLTGFARSNMGLSGPWPYLLFFALDGAAGVCAVLLARRAALGGRSLAPRLAVWGLVAASAAFNYSHAPRRPDAPEAYALMPVIAAVLFEFCLQETRSRATARSGRRLGALRWARPGESVRVRIRMSADEALSVGEASRRVRVESAARSLYRLRVAVSRQGRGGETSRRARRALRRAHAALARAGFTDASVAADVLRHVQVLTMTTALATLDYGSAEQAHAAIGSMISVAAVPALEQAGDPAPDGSAPGIASPDPQAATRPAAAPEPEPDLLPAGRGTASADGAGGDAGPAPRSPAGLDGQLVEAARQIAAAAALDGTRLSQAALVEQLRQQGWSIANDRVRWLAATAGLGRRRA